MGAHNPCATVDSITTGQEAYFEMNQKAGGGVWQLHGDSGCRN
jgi:hypothetical protein